MRLWPPDVRRVVYELNRRSAWAEELDQQMRSPVHIERILRQLQLTVHTTAGHVRSSCRGLESSQASVHTSFVESAHGAVPSLSHQCHMPPSHIQLAGAQHIPIRKVLRQHASRGDQVRRLAATAVRAQRLGTRQHRLLFVRPLHVFDEHEGGHPRHNRTPDGPQPRPRKTTTFFRRSHFIL